MSGSGVYVTEIAALATFRAELGQFGSRTRTRIAEAQASLAEVESWLTDRERHWLDEVTIWTDRVGSFQRELAWCLSDPESRSCLHIATELENAKRQLADAEESFDVCRYWIQRVDEAGSDFRAAGSAMGSTIDGVLASGVTMLEQAHDELADYAAKSAPKPAALE